MTVTSEYLSAEHERACIDFDLRMVRTLSDGKLAYEIVRQTEPERDLPLMRVPARFDVLCFEANRRGWWTMRFEETTVVKIPAAIKPALDAEIEAARKPVKQCRSRSRKAKEAL